MPEPLRVLMVEDSENDALLLLEALRGEEFAPSAIRVETEEDFRAILVACQSAASAEQAPAGAGYAHQSGTEICWDIIIADYVLPRFSGIAAIRITGEYGIDIPIIVVSGQVGEAAAVEAMRAGARDYLLKGHLDRLLPAIRRELQEAEVRRARRRAEDEREQLLVEVQRRFTELDTIFNGIVDPMIAYNADGVVIKANPATVHTLGRDPGGLSEAEVAHLLSLRSPDGREIAVRDIPVARALRGEPVRGERMLVTDAEGKEAILLVTASPLLQDGRPWGAVSIWHDITQHEQALRDAEQRAAELDATLDAIADGLIFYSPSERVLRSNAAAEAVFGLSRAELQLPLAERLRLLHIEHPDGRPFVRGESPAWRALHGETVHGIIEVIHPPDGRAAWVSGSAAPVWLADGTLIGAVTTYADITRLHALQEEREVYIHTISHDLRSPLAVVLGHAQVFQEYLAEEHLNGLLLTGTTAILRSAQRMNVMIQDMADAARFEGGQLVLECRPVPLRRYLDELLQRLAPTMEVGRVRWDILDDLPPLLADPDRLERIFTNLLTNAMKYSDPGTPIEVRARRQDDRAVISISDHGPGIPPDDVPRLFERFYRAPNTRQTEGIGLGLYITHMLVQAHGGGIWVESEVGKGSTFYFTLPLATG